MGKGRLFTFFFLTDVLLTRNQDTVYYADDNTLYTIPKEICNAITNIGCSKRTSYIELWNKSKRRHLTVIKRLRMPKQKPKNFEINGNSGKMMYSSEKNILIPASIYIEIKISD